VPKILCKFELEGVREWRRLEEEEENQRGKKRGDRRERRAIRLGATTGRGKRRRC